MIKIPVPSTSSYAESTVNLGGQSYKFVWRYNSVMERWLVDIYLNDEEVSMGEALIENTYMFYGKPIDKFSHGVIGVFRAKNSMEKVSRYNIGIDKDYEFLYLTNEEFEAL